MGCGMTRLARAGKWLGASGERLGLESSHTESGAVTSAVAASVACCPGGKSSLDRAGFGASGHQAVASLKTKSAPRF
jgi:hypothetical protein